MMRRDTGEESGMSVKFPPCLATFDAYIDRHTSHSPPATWVATTRDLGGNNTRARHVQCTRAQPPGPPPTRWTGWVGEDASCDITLLPGHEHLDADTTRTGKGHNVIRNMTEVARSRERNGFGQGLQF
mmetsp:Transcript_19803/g.42839  ORF Transcript_19803/g.42839 Transcript_19803/m.42839 type:complete len:128 (-) Transcript_19803:776-1159(-)